MNKVSAIIVTGAAAGIGRATADSLLQMGRTVVGIDYDRQALARATKELGPSFISMPVDLGDSERTIALVESVARRFELAAIIHCAGLFPQTSLAETSVELWDKVMAVNLRCAFILAREGSKAMRTGGALVFLTSGAGLIPSASDPFQRQFSLYGASKAALDRFAAGIAVDLAKARIAVVTITPGASPGTAAIDLADAPHMARVDVAHVGTAVAWLALVPRLELAGRRLDATRFGRDWGPDSDSYPDYHVDGV